MLNYKQFIIYKSQTRLNLYLVICPFLQDRTIAVWDMMSPTDIKFRKVLDGSNSYIWAVELDEKYIYGSVGYDIKVHWNTIN